MFKKIELIEKEILNCKALKTIFLLSLSKPLSIQFT